MIFLSYEDSKPLKSLFHIAYSMTPLHLVHSCILLDGPHLKPVNASRLPSRSRRVLHHEFTRDIIGRRLMISTPHRS